jgi:adenylate cyclase
MLVLKGRAWSLIVSGKEYTMDEQLKNGLLTQAIQSYEIGYLLLTSELKITQANRNIYRWLAQPMAEVVGREVIEAFPELVGVEDILKGLSTGADAFRLEEIYRPSSDGKGQYFDLQVMCLAEGDDRLLLTTVDVTRNARQELLLQQQRNEVQLLSAELAAANERLSFILNRLVPQAVAQKLIQDRQMPRPGGGALYEATILFADMRDFTVFAEAYQPADTLEFLNIYLAVVADAILRYDGSLIQLIGDMVMGVFNVPDPQPDHPARAIRAAIDIQNSLSEFNATADSRFPNVKFGVGISTGPIIAGYLGMQQRFRYAVVGDTTNVAFHLSSLAAPGRILIGETTVRAVGDILNVIEKGDIQLKRRKKLVKVYELVSLKESD